MFPRRFRQLALQIALLLALYGCAAYRPAPLNIAPPLQTSVAALNHAGPGGQPGGAGGVLSLQDVAALAVLNDPDLAAARTQHGLAEADLLSAGLLPDPIISGGFAALLSGPADAPAISGSLMEDLSALITYSVNKRAAKSGLAQVDASILWQEWQVASQAEELCIALNADAGTIRSLAANRNALAMIAQSTQAQVSAGNLTIAASSSSLAALAGTDNALNTATQAQMQDQAQLDALLGLEPSVQLQIADPDVPPIDRATAGAAIATLAARRPDLIALRYGYEQADAKLRAAIMTQFLPVTIGASGGRDTTKVVSVGPDISLTLPLFNRDRGGIAQASATRAQLSAQFRASLASAQGGAEALLVRIAVLQDQAVIAGEQAATAQIIAGNAQTAFANGDLDALSAVALQAASADRTREAITLKSQLLTARVSLATLLGIGLPMEEGPK